MILTLLTLEQLANVCYYSDPSLIRALVIQIAGLPEQFGLTTVQYIPTESIITLHYYYYYILRYRIAALKSFTLALIDDSLYDT
jgi:hypothetical protein